MATVDLTQDNFEDVVIVFSQAGAIPAAGLESVIAQIKALDMEKVHQEVAERQAQQAQQ